MPSKSGGSTTDLITGGLPVKGIPSKSGGSTLDLITGGLPVKGMPSLIEGVRVSEGFCPVFGLESNADSCALLFNSLAKTAVCSSVGGFVKSKAGSPPCIGLNTRPLSDFIFNNFLPALPQSLSLTACLKSSPLGVRRKSAVFIAAAVVSSAKGQVR